jgi:hypothetical protein
MSDEEIVGKRFLGIKNRSSLIDDLNKRFKSEAMQELYECFLKSLEKEKISERRPDGNVRVIDAVLIQLWRLAFGNTHRDVESAFNVSKSSSCRQVEWFVNHVGINYYNF